MNYLSFAFAGFVPVMLVLYYLLPKSTNRYYMLDRYIAENQPIADVQIFGSCHAYSSFDPARLETDTLFLDPEKEIAFDYERDFYDLYHLSVYGAEKATAYLSTFIEAAKNND